MCLEKIVLIWPQQTAVLLPFTEKIVLLNATTVYCHHTIMTETPDIRNAQTSDLKIEGAGASDQAHVNILNTITKYRSIKSNRN